MVKWGRHTETCVKMLKNKLFFADSLSLQNSPCLVLNRFKTLVHVSGLKKYLTFSTEVEISGVIFKMTQTPVVMCVAQKSIGKI